MNPGTLVIVNLLGGVALLLWGVRMVRTGVMRAWGDRLKRFIETRLGNRLSAFLAGAMATAILGSGTAMTLIVAGIAASGAIGMTLGLAVLLGSDVGSAAVSSLFASGSSYAIYLSPVLLFAGYVTFSVSREFRPHNIGRIMIGLGLMLLALKLIVTATAPLRDASLFHDVLAALGREPVLAFICGAILAWVFHSTLAVMLLIASFVANGSLELLGAVSFILGINAGGSLPAVMSTAALPVEARRLPIANLICRSAAALACLAFVERAMPFAARIPLQPLEIATGFHTLFNIATGLLFLPFTGLISSLMRRILPDPKETPDNLARPRYLDRVALSTPAVALSNAALETVRMSEVLDRMFAVALATLTSGSLEALKELKTLDERLNAYHAALQAYLADLAESELDGPHARRAFELMLYASNLEHAGDVISLNLADRLKAKARASIEFGPEEKAAVDECCRIVIDSLKVATGVLASNDLDGAKRLLAQKDAFRAHERRIIGAHFAGGAGGKAASLRRSALFVDLVRDLHRVHSHVVSVGYPIVEAAGLLHQSRMIG